MRCNWNRKIIVNSSIDKINRVFLKYSKKLFLQTERKYNKIISNNKYSYSILFLVTIILGVFGNLIIGTANDPGRDGAYYYDGAENLKEGRGFVLDIKEYWLDDWAETEERGKVENPYFGIIIYPVFLCCIMFLNDSLMAIRIANTIISGFTVVLLYTLLSKVFDKNIAFISCLIIIFNQLFFRAYTSIVSESFYLLFYLIPFYILLSPNESEHSGKTIITAGIFSGIVFLSRFVGLLAIASILIWFVFHKKMKNAVIYVISALLTILPWLIWNRQTTGYYFPLAHIAGSLSWPAVISTASSSTSNSIPLLVYVRDFLKLGIDLTDISMFYILAPFVIIGMIRFSKDERISLFIIFTLITILFHLKVNYGMRYMLPIVPLLIPMGVKSMKDMLELIETTEIVGIQFSGKKVFSFLILLLLLISLFNIADYVKDGRDAVNSNHNYDKYQWLKENSLEDSIICSTEARHAHYFTGRQTIILALNLNQSYLDLFIDFYNISYVVVEKLSHSHYENNDYLISLYDGNETYDLGKYQLALVHEELGNDNDILFFRVIIKNEAPGSN